MAVVRLNCMGQVSAFPGWNTTQPSSPDSTRMTSEYGRQSGPSGLTRSPSTSTTLPPPYNANVRREPEGEWIAAESSASRSSIVWRPAVSTLLETSSRVEQNANRALKMTYNGLSALAMFPERFEVRFGCLYIPLFHFNGVPSADIWCSPGAVHLVSRMSKPWLARCFLSR